MKIEVKNSFIHVSDQIDKNELSRSRALSEWSGMCKAEELKKSDPVPAIYCLLAQGKVDVQTIMETPKFFGKRYEAKEAGLKKSTRSQSQNQSSSSPISTLGQAKEARTTIMMRDIPNSYSTSRLIELFDTAGFQGTYDFVYLPIDFRTKMSLGYAFVNFVDSGVAQQFMICFEGFSSWHFSSPKVCNVSWSVPNQGLEEHVERYRNSPIMHEGVPDEFKPRLYEGGVRVAFPGPTKRIKPPRVRPAKQRW